MTGKIQTRLAVLGALAALVAVLIPAGLASGSHDDGETSTPDPSVVLLTLGNTDQVTWTGDPSLTQGITTSKNDCLTVDFADVPELLAVNAQGGQLGEVKDGLGVQGPDDGSGEPCGRVENPEAISVSLGSHFGDLDGEYVMTAVDLDLELKFEAVVNVSYRLDGNTVATDVFNPMLKTDDGPDSKDGDNYRYFHRPGVTGVDPAEQSQIFFDEVLLEAESGAFSLEGGADLAGNNEPAAFGQLDETSKSSQFEVKHFDGFITCGQTIDIDKDAVGLVTLHSLNANPMCSASKPFNDELNLDEAELAFVPQFEGQGRYTLQVTLENQPITVNESGQITSLEAMYNTSGDLTLTGEGEATEVQPCNGQPIDSPDANGNGLVTEAEQDAYNAFWGQGDVGLLPDGESVCFYHSSVTPTGEGEGTEFWKFYFEDDPGMFM